MVMELKGRLDEGGDARSAAGFGLTAAEGRGLEDRGLCGSALTEVTLFSFSLP